MLKSLLVVAALGAIPAIAMANDMASVSVQAGQGQSYSVVYTSVQPDEQAPYALTGETSAPVQTHLVQVNAGEGVPVQISVPQ